MNRGRSRGDERSPLLFQQHKSISHEGKRILQEDERYFIHQESSTPCINAIKKCEGIYIEDYSGKRYMDFHGNNVHHLGFGMTELKEAVISQMETLPFSPRRYTNERAVELAKKLAGLAPGDLNRVLFAPGATSLVSSAMILARAATGKNDFISFWDSFHGGSIDARSIGGDTSLREDIGNLLPGCHHLPAYNSYRGEFEYKEILRLLEYELQKNNNVAGIIMETFRNTDVQVPPVDFLKGIREICDRNGVLLILDETPTALGRTGRFFAFERFGIEPDMVIIGKGLGGGIIPMAALIARDELNVAYDSSAGHYTHEKSPLGSAAALAVIDYIERHNICDRALKLSGYAESLLRELYDRYEIIGDIRVLGMQFAVELVRDRKTKEKATDEAQKVMYRAMELGLSFKVSQGSTLTLTPPLTIGMEELETAFDILERAIDEVAKRDNKRYRSLMTDQKILP